MAGYTPDNKTMIRAVALSVAIIVFVLTLVNLDFGFLAALFWALVAGGLMLALLHMRYGSTLEDAQPLPPPAPVARNPDPAPKPASSPADSKDAPKATDAPAANEAGVAASDAGPAANADGAPQAAPAASKVRPTKTLAGQDDVSAHRGEWTYRRAGAEPQPEGAGPTATLDAEARQPARLDAPRPEGADDLKRIKGVGPKLEDMLNSMGFYHFDQIASWTGEEIAWVDANLEGFKGRVTRDEWVRQAAELANAKPD